MNRIIITGPGRSGTSFIMQLLTRMGLDTGYEPYKELFVEAYRAGCEQQLTIFDDNFDDAPKYIKGPIWAYWLKYVVKNDLFKIERVVMPLRDLTESAYSRLDVGLAFMIDKEFIPSPRGDVMEKQENVLAMLTGKVLEVCYLYDIPLTLMRYPRLVMNEQYCYDKMSEFAEIDRDEFGVKWKELERSKSGQNSGR